MAFKLSKDQRSLVKTKSTTKNTLWLEGPAGTGKTTTSVHRMRDLLERGIDPGSILVLVPQRTLAQPYADALVDAPAGADVTLTTIAGLSHQMVEFFWPLVAGQFGQPDRPPTFLSLETVQYYMGQLIAPLIETRGFFETLALDRARLYSQIHDGLSKSAVVGFPYTEIGARLKEAWVGDEPMRHVYEEVQTCATLFREFCIEHNLLDFSLQLDTFMRVLWPMPECRNYLLARYTHLIVDNIEEDNPTTHALLREWLPKSESALVVYDTDAGYRRFLGSDPESALTLKKLCKRKEAFTDSFVASVDLQAFGDQIALSLDKPVEADANIGDPKASIAYDDHRFHPQMIDWTAQQVARLVHGEGIAPNDIVILAPYMSDALRFSLASRLAEQEVPTRSHRPSRSLREEAAVQAMLTFAQIAHPEWRSYPDALDMAYAMMTTIDGLDLVRAQLLTQIVYRVRNGVAALTPFETLIGEMQERITPEVGERYDYLRGWLEAYAVDKQYADSEIPLDHFLTRLFGEVLSQEGYGFHNRVDAALQAANLIDSARGFRQVVGDSVRSGQEYVEAVGAGLIANQYVRGWESGAEGVLLTPAYTFLMRNQPVDYQFWLNVSGGGWSERVYQPLTHPYVLSAWWPAGERWTDDHETATELEALYRLALGLVRRCRKGIYLGFSELSEQGGQERGELLGVIQRMMRRLSPPGEDMLVELDY